MIKARTCLLDDFFCFSVSTSTTHFRTWLLFLQFPIVRFQTIFTSIGAINGSKQNRLVALIKNHGFGLRIVRKNK